MAIFHFRHGFLQRSRGASSVAKAAYNSGQKIEDNKGSSERSDYTRKGGVLYDEIALPKGSPQWANERGELWRRLEAREDKSTRRADAVLAHNIDVALPCELTLEQNIFLLRDFVREQFTRKGYAVDWSIHAPDPRGDDRNYHGHILVPLRKIEAQSFGKKDRYHPNTLRKQMIHWREAWAKLANRHLERYGFADRIDARSLRAQGVAHTPIKYKGRRPKVKRAGLDAIRTPQPRSPVVKMTKTIGADGSIRVVAAISHSALNNIGKPNPPPFFPAQPNRKGWPPEAVRDWESWGHREVTRFFSLWKELAPPNFQPR